MDEISDSLTFITQKSAGWFIAKQAVAQTIATASDTAITFTTEEFDRDGGHSTSVNTSRYTGKTNYGYLCGGGVNYAASSSGAYRVAALGYNSGSFVSSVTFPPITSGTTRAVAVPTIVYFNGSTDYLELYGRHNTGGNLDTSTADGSSQFWVIAIAA
jgi:hypothetical protein